MLAAPAIVYYTYCEKNVQKCCNIKEHRLKTDFGIYKAMGFTSSQLMVQTVGSITPCIFLGALVSAISGILYLPVMYNGIFGVIGAVKNNFEIPLYVLLGTAVILTTVTIVLGIILCRPVRRIEAYTLIRN